MFGVFGSGFGLYGYLPALLQAGQSKVLLPERYRARFDERAELATYREKVEWVKDDNVLLNRATGLVVARRPATQYELLPKILEHAQARELLLEKPLAPTPSEAQHALDRLEQSAAAFRIGFLFPYTSWGQTLFQSPLRGDPTVVIRWSFLAHHFRNDLANWKRFHSQGGGALRFYGIHLVHLLSQMGYREVDKSFTVGEDDEPASWSATFSGPNVSPCQVDVDSRSLVDAFSIRQNDLAVCDLGDPFANSVSAQAGDDPRVPLLVQLVKSLAEDQTIYASRYRTAVDLWAQVEARMSHRTMPRSPSTML